MAVRQHECVASSACAAPSVLRAWREFLTESGMLVHGNMQGCVFVPSAKQCLLGGQPQIQVEVADDVVLQVT
jgi:hypothetical protein